MHCVQATREVEQARHDACAAQSAKAEVAWELQSLAATSRKHVRALCDANARLERRGHALSQQLLAAVPSQAYYLLLEKYHAALSQRRDAALSAAAQHTAGGEQLDAARTLAELQQRYDKACARAAAAEEAARIGQTLAKCDTPDATADLAADLKQRAVEVEAARQEAAAAERRSGRLQVDAHELQQELSDLRDAHGRQAKRAYPLERGPGPEQRLGLTTLVLVVHAAAHVVTMTLHGCSMESLGRACRARACARRGVGAAWQAGRFREHAAGWHRSKRNDCASAHTQREPAARVARARARRPTAAAAADLGGQGGGGACAAAATGARTRGGCRGAGRCQGCAAGARR